MHIHIGRSVLGVTALEQVWHTARVFDNFQTAHNFAQCIVEDFAVLGGDERSELFFAFVEEFTIAEQDLGAFGERGVAPCRKCSFCCCNGFINGGLTAHRDLAGDHTGCRVCHISPLDRCLCAFGIGVIDPMIDGLRLLGSFGGSSHLVQRVHTVHPFLLTESSVPSPCPVDVRHKSDTVYRLLRLVITLCTCCTSQSVRSSAWKTSKILNRSLSLPPLPLPMMRRYVGCTF